MKKILIFILLLVSFAANASHFMGGQINYEFVGSNRYLVKLTIYRDCGGIPLSSNANISISSVSGSFNVNLPRVSSREVSLQCPGQTTNCSGGTGAFGVEEHVYADIVTLPPVSGFYKIQFEGNARNAAITTLVGAGSQSLFLEATLNPNLTSRNTSANLLNIPIANFAPNQLATISPNGYDADGDVLRYSLVNARQYAYNSVNYAPGFSGLNPLSSSTPITINPNTGQITFTPSTNNQIAVIAIKVEEFRNGVLIGEVYRDIQIRVFNIPTNNYPVITPVTTVVIAPGQTFCTNITAVDVNNDSIDLSIVGSVANSNFSVILDSVGKAVGRFCFMPSVAQQGHTFSFTVNAIDDACPIVLASSMTFNIIVPKPCASLGLTANVTNATSCGQSDGAIVLSNASAMLPVSYYWQSNNSLVSASQNMNNISSGRYCVTVVDGNNCVDSLCVDVINVNDTIVRDTILLTNCSKVAYNGVTYTSSTSFTNTIKNINGCDSILRYVAINVIKPVSVLINKLSCNGSKIEYGGKIYGLSTQFVDTLKSTKGCDSVYVHVSIIIRSIAAVTVTKTYISCTGKLTFNGKTYTASTTLRDTLRTAEGCDSVLFVNNIVVQALLPVQQAVVFTGCGSYTHQGKVYYTNTLLKDTVKTKYGCDSLYRNVSINITQPLVLGVTLLNRGYNTICKGSLVTLRAYTSNAGSTPTYQWFINNNLISGNNSDYFTSNSISNDDTVKVVVTSSLPCVANNNTTSNVIVFRVVSPVITTVNLSGCNNVTYNNIIYNASTVVNDTVRNYLGCDSIIKIVKISINKVMAETENINVFACQSYTFRGKIYYAATVVKDTLRNINGCDSLYRITNIAINNIQVITNTQNITGCTKVMYQGNIYNTSTVVRDTLRTAFGCDSIYNIANITITPATVPAISITASQNPLCNVANVVLYAQVTNGGTNPQYQWLANGVPVSGANGASYTLSGVLDTNVVYTCSLISSLPCVEPASVVSNPLSIKQGKIVVPVITIQSNLDTVCNGATVSFTATAINAGTQPVYSWYVNGVLVASGNSNQFQTIINASKTVYCILNSNAACISMNNVQSNIKTIVLRSAGSTVITSNIITGPASLVVGNTAQFQLMPPYNNSNYSVFWLARSMEPDSLYLQTAYSIQMNQSGLLTVNAQANPFTYLVVDAILTDNVSKCHYITANHNRIEIVSRPSPITGNNTICAIGNTTTLQTTTSIPCIDNWSSSNPSIASVSFASTGKRYIHTAVIRALNTGTTNVSFIVTDLYGNNYVQTIQVRVVGNNIASITGLSKVCVGSSIQLANATPSGIWSSVAGRANISNTGLVTGTSAGQAQIRYTVVDSATGCTAFQSKIIEVKSIPAIPSIAYAPFIVNPQAGAPTGSLCLNRTFDVVGTPLGGVWLSNNTSVITVSSNGTVRTVGNGRAGVSYTISDANGCTNSRTISMNVVTCAAKALNNAVTQNSEVFNVYPNPAHTSINIKLDRLLDKGVIVVTDLYGKQYKKNQASIGVNTINISDLSKGVYIVSLSTVNGLQTQKIIVE